MKNVFILLLCLGLYGCATVPRYNVGVNSINSGEEIVGGKKCVIFPGMKDTTKDDLQFTEYERYVARALSKKGYTVTDNPGEAEIAVFLSYGIGDPQAHTFSYSMPVFGQTGVSSAQTYGSVQGFGNSATYSGTTTYTPSYGVVGATSGVGEYTTYTRYIRLDAFDLIAYRESKKEKHLWKTDMISTGSSGDLRRVFPVMVAAAVPYISENTQNMKEIQLEENDKRILEIVNSETKDSSIDKKKKDAQTHFEKGVVYADAKETEKAIFECNKAEELDPDNALNHFLLGNLFFDKKNYGNAVLEYKEVTRIDPKMLRAYIMRGFVYVLTDDYDQAILECNKAIKIDPNFAEAYDLRGIIYEKQKKYTESLADTEQAKKLGFSEDEKKIEDLREKIKQGKI